MLIYPCMYLMTEVSLQHDPSTTIQSRCIEDIKSWFDRGYIDDVTKEKNNVL